MKKKWKFFKIVTLIVLFLSFCIMGACSKKNQDQSDPRNKLDCKLCYIDERNYETRIVYRKLSANCDAKDIILELKKEPEEKFLTTYIPEDTEVYSVSFVFKDGEDKGEAEVNFNSALKESSFSKVAYKQIIKTVEDLHCVKEGRVRVFIEGEEWNPEQY